MKNMVKSTLALSLILCMLLTSIPAASALWDFSNGMPDNWYHQNDVDMVDASGVLDTVNPNATQEAKNLLAYLQLVGDSQQFIAGQFDFENDDSPYQAIMEEFGYEPTLYSARYYVEVSAAPTFKTDANGNETTEITSAVMDFKKVPETNQLLIDHYNNGNILLVHSDSAPRSVCAAVSMKNKPELYDSAADAVIELDQTNPDRDMQAYALWMKYQQNLISALKELEHAGVKAYLWRPWIEYNYHPFSGKTPEGRAAFVRVYQQTVNMLVDAGLKGFLVCFSPGGYCDIRLHNPGTEYIDTYAFTVYSKQLGSLNGGYLHNDSLELVRRSGKPLGFSEFSCRSGAVAEATVQARASSFDLLQSAMTYWPQLAWVNFWSGLTFATDNKGLSKQGNDDGILYWSSDYAITLDEMPDYRVGVIKPHGVAQLFTAANGAGDYIPLAEKNYTAADLKKAGLSAADVRSLRLNRGYAITFWSNDNCTGEQYSYGFSQKNLGAAVATKFKSLSVVRLENAALNQNEIYASVNDGGAWKANDGYTTYWQGDATAADNESKAGTAWLYVDLGAPYEIGRYMVKSAAFAGLDDQFNVAAFQFQYSNDGVNWKLADTVTDNTAGQLDRYFEPVTAQYFRLYITRPNNSTVDVLKGEVYIAEFELYGMQAVEIPEPTPTTTTKKTTTTTKKVTTTTKKTTKKTTTTTALKLATPKVTVSNATKGVKVSWGKVSKADKYYVYRKTGSGSWSKIKTTTSVSYTDEGAKAGKSYQYMVKAVKGSVTSGYKAVSITRLSVPKVTVSNATKGVKVSWGKVTGASKYYVYRKTGSGSWSKIKTTTSTSYTDTKAAAGKNYQYMVKAVKGDHTSYYKAASIRRLKAPSSVKLAKATKGFKVSWSKVTGATKYEVYRKTGNGSYTKIATTTKTAYTDKTAKKGKYYTYRVRAVYSSYKSVFKTGSKTKR